MSSERSIQPTTTVLLASVLAAAGLACAAPQIHTVAVPYEPQGPGTQFATLEAAVIDALAYAHHEARESKSQDLLRGGAITRSDRGFTYGEIAVARAERPHHIEYRLVQSAVARFHAYPRTNRPREDFRNERPSRKDRLSVDRADPLHRPVFVLTPRLLVKAYYGDRQPVETVANLQRLTQDRYYAQADPAPTGR